MKVMKFGGTSVGTVESLTNVKKIVEETPGKKVVVVSALGGITDLLISTARLAVADDIAYLEQYARIVERHLTVINGVVPANRRDATEAMVKMMLDELANIYKGVMLLHDLSDRALKIIVSYGERLSSVIVSNIIKGATFFDSRSFIRTRRTSHGNDVLDTELTNRLIQDEVCGYDWETAVMGGFLATDDNGEVTNLGRGGSDYTASIMAAALNADVLEIWTDVDGFMTADPKVINNAYVIDELTFTEAMELCNFGAKVIYPPTIYPVYHKDIPIIVKNTFNPTAPGTRISSRAHHEEEVDQRYIINQRHLPCDDHESLHGGRDRCELKDIQRTDRERGKRVSRVAGCQREQHHHSGEKRRCRPCSGNPKGGIRAGTRHRHV